MNDADWLRKRTRNLGRGCLGGTVVLLAVALAGAAGAVAYGAQGAAAHRTATDTSAPVTRGIGAG